MALPDGRVPVVLTAHAADLVEQDAAAILRYLDRRPAATDVAAVAATLLRTRRLRRHRAAVLAAERAELTDALRVLAAGDDHPLVTRATAGGPGRTAFVFPGQGSQWPAMGVEAYERLPVYRTETDTCAAEFAARGLASPLDYLLADEGSTTNDFTQLQIQGAQFVHGVALAAVWRSYGVLPDITVGHSLGEIGAAYVAGAITLPVAVGVVAARATLLDTLTGPYRVAVLGVSPEAAQDVIAATPGWVELSVVNSPTSVAISGETDAVAAAVRTVVERGVFAREIEMWFPAHTTALDPLRAELEALLPAGEFAETAIQFIGSATASVVPAGTDFAGYWYENLRSTVRFDRAVAAAVASGATTFVELSAHPALLFAMGDVLESTQDLDAGTVTLVGSGRRDEPLTDRLSANIVAVALGDPRHRWADAVDDGTAPLPDFPFAPMRAEHLWAAAEPLPAVAGLTVAAEHWEPTVVGAAPGVRSVAVLDLGDGALAARLGDAVAAHPGAEMVAPERADLLVVVPPVLDGSAGADALADAVDAGLLRYPDRIAADTRDVWLVTVAAERVTQGDNRSRPALALAAMHRSVGFEHPDHDFRHLDLPSGLFDTVTAVDVFLGATDDVALRDGVAHRRALRDEQNPAPVMPRSAFDEVVVTGGAGAVGLHFARALVERGTRRMVLLSRRGVDPAVIADLGAGHDVEIVAPRCDITDRAQLTAVAGEFAGGGASLVVHAAGAAVIAPAADLTGAAVRDSCAAKVSGLEIVAEVWPMRDDARLLLCSSVSGLWGGSGHAAYAAANRLQDFAAERLRAAGRSCTSVRWGLWPGDGVIDGSEVERVERSGLTAMVPERAVDAALRDHTGDPVVYSADTDRLGVFLGTVATAPTAVAAEEAESADLDAGGAVRAALSAVLKVADTTGMDLDASLLDLGVDSLLAIDLRKKLKKATGQNVPLAVILGGATATEIIGRLEEPRLGNPA
jgi:mycobactin polyketide synthetase MbtD